MRKWWSCKGGLVNQNTNYDPSTRWCVQIVAKRRINILPIKQSHAEAFLQKVETQQEIIWREEGKNGIRTTSTTTSTIRIPWLNGPVACLLSIRLLLQQLSETLMCRYQIIVK